MSADPTNPKLDGADYIRPFAAADRDMVEQLVGQGFMEGLAAANNRVYKKPTTILFALTLGMGLNYLFKVHKGSLSSWTTYAQMVIGPCLVFLPILALVEYRQRPDFDARMRTYVRGEDIRSPAEYYTPPGGCWVFQHKESIIGVVMLDAHSPGGEVTPGAAVSLKSTVHARDKPEVVSEAEKLRRVESGKRSTIAELRHVDVDGMYRNKGVGVELAGHALDEAFGIGKDKQGVKKVIALTSPFTPGGDALWNRLGFTPVKREAGWREDKGLGWDKWSGEWVAVDRESWLAARGGLYAKYEEADKEGKKDQ